MANETSKPTEPTYAGPTMVRIDGGRVRKLRESRGLTQLYISTVVGVTTDTISRWENKRYQSIKLENGEKLAQALEVELAEILEQAIEEPAAPLPGAEPDKAGEVPPPAHRLPDQKKIFLLLAAASVVLVAGPLIFRMLPGTPEMTVSASRVLPRHAPPGQPFPVLVRVHSAEPDAISLIIRENFPVGCEVSGGVPQITTLDRNESSLKWISRVAPGDSVYAYLCRLPATAVLGDSVAFNGAVTRKNGPGREEEIGGSSTVEAAPFHWADTDRDNMIDDEEILAVYDLYSDIEELGFDRDLVDSIWAGSGYRWDNGDQNYIVLE